MNSTATTSNTPDTRKPAVRKFWDGIEAISGPQSFTKFSRESIPRSEKLSALLGTIKFMPPDQRAPLAIDVITSGVSFSPGCIRQLVGLIPLVPVEDEQALITTLVNHKQFRHPEDLFELKEHAHWIRNPHLREIALNIKDDATGHPIDGQSLNKGQASQLQRKIDKLAASELARLRRAVKKVSQKTPNPVSSNGSMHTQKNGSSVATAKTARKRPAMKPTKKVSAPRKTLQGPVLAPAARA